MRSVCALFVYLDRTHVLRAGALGEAGRSLWGGGLQLFGACLEALPEVRAGALEGVLGLVQAERQGAAPRTLLLLIIILLLLLIIIVMILV